jgi:ribonuclease P/MRP protein subunit RPP1
MREFIDLGVQPKEDSLESVIETAKQLGYSRIGVEGNKKSDILDIVNRVDLNPRNQNELGKQLRKLRYKTEIIVVHCATRSVSRQAARDNRVDFCRFPISGGKRIQYLDRRQAGLMRDSGAGYEVCVQELFVDDRVQLIKRIGIIRKSLNIALKYGLPVVASSGANDPNGLRGPHELASLLSLLGVDEEPAMDMVSTVPNGVIEENRAKLGPNFIAPGVWIIDE